MGRVKVPHSRGAARAEHHRARALSMGSGRQEGLQGPVTRGRAGGGVQLGRLAKSKTSSTSRGGRLN